MSEKQESEEESKEGGEKNGVERKELLVFLGWKLCRVNHWIRLQSIKQG